MRRALLPLVLVACASSSEPPEVYFAPSGVSIRSTDLVLAEVLDPSGRPLTTRRLQEPVDELELRVPWQQGGRHVVRLVGADGEQTLPVEVPIPLPVLEVHLEAPLGQPPEPVADGDRLSVIGVGGGPVRVGVRVRAWRAGELELEVGGERQARAVRDGEITTLVADVDGETPVEVRLGAEVIRAELLLEETTIEEARSALSVRSLAFPAEATGVVDVSRLAGRVTLPAPWWRSALRILGLGTRARDRNAPWAWVAVTLSSRASHPVSVSVRSRVLTPEGQPVEAFRPAMRGRDDGSGMVRALVLLPPGEDVVASLPVYVDDEAVEVGPYRLGVEVAPVGLDEVLVEAELPIAVNRGSTAASLGVVLSVGLGLFGLVGLAGWVRYRMPSLPTTALVTVALFASLTFVASAGGMVVATVAASLLGPFAVFVSSLVDEALTTALLATLLTLLPRRGIAALCALVGAALGWVALGAFGPVGLLLLGVKVACLESALWLAGITRGGSWRDGSRLSRWMRLTLALGGSGLVSSLTGLLLHIVLYRLFYAPWYIAAVVIGPGFLYTAIAVGLAIPFAESLRRIQR